MPSRRGRTMPTRSRSSPAGIRSRTTKCASSTTPGASSANGQEGRLEFRGPSITTGYFRNEAKTRELFHDGWVDSGDRAYIAGGDIHITGRVKDIIIRAGRNIYPQEIEEAVGDPRHPQGRRRGVRRRPIRSRHRAADRDGGDQGDATRRRAPALQPRAHEVVTEIAGSAADEIVLVPPRAVPKTSSGKVRRCSAKELYETGRTDVKQSAVVADRAAWRCRASGRSIDALRAAVGEMLYAAWWLVS